METTNAAPSDPVATERTGEPAESSSSAVATARATRHAVRSTLPTDDPAIREIVEEFLDSIGGRLDAMSAALAAENYEELAKVAHALKGSGGTAGFDCFTKPAARIETLAKENDPTDVPALIDEIRELETAVVV